MKDSTGRSVIFYSQFTTQKWVPPDHDKADPADEMMYCHCVTPYPMDDHGHKYCANCHKEIIT